MGFEWDDEKNRENIRKHGVSFEAVYHFDFDEAWQFEDEDETDEERTIAVGFIGNKVFYLVYTMRFPNVRVISLRRATRQEVRDYVDYKEGRW